jgi:hypothetical protein
LDVGFLTLTDFSESVFDIIIQSARPTQEYLGQTHPTPELPPNKNNGLLKLLLLPGRQQQYDP